jgi:hypothetical protein
VGASVQSTAGSRGVSISGSNAGYTVFRAHSIRQFPLHFPSRASPCAITFQLESTNAVHLTAVQTIDKKLQKVTADKEMILYKRRHSVTIKSATGEEHSRDKKMNSRRQGKVMLLVISFLAVQEIFICVYITNYLHFFTMFLKLKKFLKNLKTITFG